MRQQAAVADLADVELERVCSLRLRPRLRDVLGVDVVCDDLEQGLASFFGLGERVR
jgi:hypothetical protein